MENIVNVEGTELDVREYNGQMVVTFDDIDLVHKRPSGTARKAFNRNKKRFINGVCAGGDKIGHARASAGIDIIQVFVISQCLPNRIPFIPGKDWGKGRF